ncbi:hypothetical protein VNO80_33062 [Phaseolus coccineus]|uniref:Uncharacterized protein n=1 Tax=Phaseolus coccineus TaxID=3886 RepID=A0AAN9KYY1_PHACN
MNRKRGGRGSFIKGGKRGVGPPCAALERRDFKKVTLSNLFYLSLEVGRDKVNMILICVGFYNETKHFFFSEGSVPHSDFHDGNNLRTPALQ